ncbi:MAG: trypsin-like serine protease, partial [Bdellovibrionota bacterium]
GVLVSKNVILTAGHCMWAFEKSKGLTILFFKGSDAVSDVYLRDGDYDLVTHPDFDEDGATSAESFHDLGLVVVSWDLAPRTHGAPKLFAGDLKAGDQLVTVGNGLTESGTTNTTGEGMLRYVPSKLKSIATKNNGQTVRAYSVTSKGNGTCGGDSGGAVYVRTPENLLALAGVHVSGDDKLSSEIGCGTKTGITVLTATMRRWMRSYL